MSKAAGRSSRARTITQSGAGSMAKGGLLAVKSDKIREYQEAAQWRTWL